MNLYNLQTLAKLYHKKGDLTIEQIQTLAKVSRATAYRIRKEYEDKKSDLNLMIDGLRFREKSK